MLVFRFGHYTRQTYLQIHGILVDLALVLIVALRVVEHGIDVTHEMIYRLIFLPFLLPLERIS